MRILVLSKSRFFGLTLLVLLAGSFFLRPAGVANLIRQASAILSGRIIPIYSVETPEKKVAVTFDATWGADQTPRLLEILAKNQVRATFFLCGLWLEKYPEMVKAIARAGHEIGNHTYTHPHLNRMAKDEIARELLKTHSLIQELTGQTPTLFRPPFGEYNNKVIETAAACGYTTIIWDIDSLDWQDLSAAAMLERVQKQLRPGAIILFHNAGKHTPEAVAALLPILKSKGYSVVPVSQLLLKGETYTDHTGRQRLKRSSPAGNGSTRKHAYGLYHLLVSERGYR
ncbi:MAG: polysaccharide deacetylase family protein [Firmicutes bacterium]|nr:polysaccharide deacetylase family protein [Bacillota bacterium]